MAHHDYRCVECELVTEVDIPIGADRPSRLECGRCGAASLRQWALGGSFGSGEKKQTTQTPEPSEPVSTGLNYLWQSNIGVPVHVPPGANGYVYNNTFFGEHAITNHGGSVTASGNVHVHPDHE